MRIAVSSQGADMNSQVDPRFGRASMFLIINSDDLSYETMENRQNLDLPQGAGIQTAQNVARIRPGVVLTGNCGPKAFRALQAAGIDVVVGVTGTIQEAVQAYMEGKYQPSEGANVEGHWA